MTQMEKDIHEIAKAITKIANKDNIKVNNEIIDKMNSIPEKYLVEVKDIDKNDDTDMPLERTESLSTGSDLVNAIGVPAMLEQTGEDAVSRKAVVEYIKNSDAELGHDSENELVVEDILTMPSVKPVACIATVKFGKEDIHELVNEKMKDIVVERKKGKWVNIHDREEWYGDQYRCSLCGNVTIDNGLYCPHCGTEMENGK